MKTQGKILIAFLLNLLFAALEFVGGVLTGSVAILSDAVHDLGDAAGIGVSFLLERKSHGQPNDTYTYGYARYAVLGSAMTTLLLLIGSGLVMVRAIERFITPVPLDYNGMILLAVVGVAINLIAALVTRDGDSLNQKAVNLHMLEDVLGWLAVLVGAVVMRFVDLPVLDPLLSLGVAAFILIRAIGNLRDVLDVLLEKAPSGIIVSVVRQHVCEIPYVRDVHHLHVWSLDGQHHYATLHIVADGDPHTVKERVRRELHAHGIGHVTLELETENEACDAIGCHVEPLEPHHHHHHH